MNIETKEEIITLRGIDLRIRLVKNIEALCTEPENEEKIPYWADIWPAARVMAREIWESIDFKGEEVLELGAGLGLPGITAALKNGIVTFSDFKEDALKMAVENAALNGIKNVKTHFGDWRSFTLKKRYKWILASDLLYNSASNPYAEKVFNENISKKGTLIIAHANRDATFKSVERLTENHFSEVIRKEEKITLDAPYFPNYKISLHYLTKK